MAPQELRIAGGDPAADPLLWARPLTVSGDARHHLSGPHPPSERRMSAGRRPLVPGWRYYDAGRLFAIRSGEGGPPPTPQTRALGWLTPQAVMLCLAAWQWTGNRHRLHAAGDVDALNPNPKWRRRHLAALYPVGLRRGTAAAALGLLRFRV